MRTPINTIIVGCDGRARGLQAVIAGREVAAATGARLLLAAVFNDPAMPFPLTLAAHPGARRATEVAIANVRNRLAPAAQALAAPDFSPAHGLRRLAHRYDADLVVVGSRHPSPRSRILDGDHALQVLHGAECAVMVVPETAAGRGLELRSIAVGIDGGPESLKALTLARTIARGAGATLSATLVVPDLPPAWLSGGAGMFADSSWSDQLDEYVGEGRAMLDGVLTGDPDERIESEVVVGNPVDELTRLCASHDLLVVGSRRWGPLRRLALGSTSEAVVRRAPGAVLVLPRGVAHPRVDAPSSARGAALAPALRPRR